MTNKLEKVIVVSDWHIPFHDTEATDKFLNLLKYEQPDELVLNGNMNDCSMFSRHPKKKEVAMMFKTAREERREWFKVAKKLRKVLPNAKITYIGSDCHEGWIETAASMSDITIDDPQYEIQNWFKLEEFGINYEREYYNKNGFIFTHGVKARSESGQSAKVEFGTWGTNGASAHTHRLGAYYHSTRGIPSVWFECGCMCRRQSWYKMRGCSSYMNWQQGFLAMTFEGDIFSGQLIPILRNSKDKPMIFFNGRKY